jgi:hypothetical protein
MCPQTHLLQITMWACLAGLKKQQLKQLLISLFFSVFFQEIF